MIRGMPLKNSDFGWKNISLWLKDFDYYTDMFLDSKRIGIFFPKWATNHPYLSGSQPNTPNWYYYWTQTSANVYNPYLYSTTVGCNNICGQSEPGQITYGCYRETEPNQFYICESAGENIDLFAITNIHEGTHMNE